MANAQGSSNASWYRRKLRGPVKWVAWILTTLLVAFIVLVIYRIPAASDEQKSAAAVAAIEAQHLTMADVSGQHLPPPPDPVRANVTVAGIDANGNGIRDDVELAIFKKYPGDVNIKIRAAELQYAMTEQMFLTQVFDSATWKAVAETDDRAFQCIGALFLRTDVQLAYNQTKEKTNELEKLVFNTQKRTEYQSQIDKNYETSFGSTAGAVCDLNIKM